MRRGGGHWHLGATQGLTVLFCDVVDSTALGESTDPEAVRPVLARYFERMKRSLTATAARSRSSSATR